MDCKITNGLDGGIELGGIELGGIELSGIDDPFNIITSPFSSITKKSGYTINSGNGIPNELSAK